MLKKLNDEADDRHQENEESEAETGKAVGWQAREHSTPNILTFNVQLYVPCKWLGLNGCQALSGFVGPLNLKIFLDTGTGGRPPAASVSGVVKNEAKTKPILAEIWAAYRLVVSAKGVFLQVVLAFGRV